MGRPGQTECPRELVLTNSRFADCIVLPSTGAGGSVAVFDTSAIVTDCRFDRSQGTAVLFESSSPRGDHTISVSEAVLGACKSQLQMGAATAV